MARHRPPLPGTMLLPDNYRDGGLHIAMFYTAELALGDPGNFTGAWFTGGLCLTFVPDRYRPGVTQNPDDTDHEQGAVLVLDSATMRVAWVYNDDVVPA